MAEPGGSRFFQIGKILQIGFSVLFLVLIEEVVPGVFDGRLGMADQVDHAAAAAAAVGPSGEPGQDRMGEAVFRAAGRADRGRQGGTQKTGHAPGRRLVQAVPACQFPVAAADLPEGSIIERSGVPAVDELPYHPYALLPYTGGNKAPMDG